MGEGDGCALDERFGEEDGDSIVQAETVGELEGDGVEEEDDFLVRWKSDEHDKEMREAIRPQKVIRGSGDRGTTQSISAQQLILCSDRDGNVCDSETPQPTSTPLIQTPIAQHS